MPLPSGISNVLFTDGWVITDDGNGNLSIYGSDGNCRGVLSGGITQSSYISGSFEIPATGSYEIGASGVLEIG
jgi:hypothetical protein